MENQKAPQVPFSAKIVLGILIVALVLVSLIIFETYHIPSWPAYVAMILFFIVHENVALVPNIIVGGAFGIFCFFLLEVFLKATAPLMGGILIPVLIFVGVFVFLIVLLTDYLPYLFNSFAFLYFTISILASESAHNNPMAWVTWLATEVIGGLLLILGVIGSFKVLGNMLRSAARSDASKST
ncbi:hypothetical protein SAMN02745218_01938 [Desulfofundulus australicus DSM 11792]|uniref:DUF1097 domain-containing protein n=1 Tax=Desulfofundulus australicus DSM 11792 TaxID=1121425 RepID=A0A1M5ALE4_9FIRM|nr:hypothetical protein [Desulfofundulus australicus]SHF30937.1 hypothetical protein SAMN02745218_01938 [Desulfofundulus australicus DSM 11792]